MATLWGFEGMPVVISELDKIVQIKMKEQRSLPQSADKKLSRISRMGLYMIFGVTQLHFIMYFLVSNNLLCTHNCSCSILEGVSALGQ